MIREGFLVACALALAPLSTQAGVLGTLTVPAIEEAAAADDAERVQMADSEILSDAEMQDLRGGFVDPTGLIYNFAINVRSDVDGNQIFTRTISVAPNIDGALQANIVNKVSAEVPSGLNVSVINNGSGITITDATGNVSTLISQTPNGAPSSIVMNASNDRALTQTVDISLILKNVANVETFARAAAQAALAQRLAVHNLGF